MLDHIILKLFIYLENSTNNTNTTCMQFNRENDMSVFKLPRPDSAYEIVFRFCNKVCLLLPEIIFNILVKKVLRSLCFLIESKKMLKMSSFYLPQALRRWRHWATAFSIIL